MLEFTKILQKIYLKEKAWKCLQYRNNILYFQMWTIITSRNAKTFMCKNENTRDLFNHTAQSIDAKRCYGSSSNCKNIMSRKMPNGTFNACWTRSFMYLSLSKEKIDRIIDEHILGGNPWRVFNTFSFGVKLLI